MSSHSLHYLIWWFNNNLKEEALYCIPSLDRDQRLISLTIIILKKRKLCASMTCLLLRTKPLKIHLSELLYLQNHLNLQYSCNNAVTWTSVQPHPFLKNKLDKWVSEATRNLSPCPFPPIVQSSSQSTYKSTKDKSVGSQMWH